MIIKSILTCFELVQGLRVNFHKNKIGGIGLVQNVLENYVTTLNCNHKTCPFKYLRMLIGGNPRKIVLGGSIGKN